jgi:CheY-like chemotaxis protein
VKRILGSSSMRDPSSSDTPRRRLLYVEDDAANRQVALVRLEKKYDVVMAKNDEEACQALVRHGAELEVILMDIELQGSRLNGIDLTRLIRGQLPVERMPPYALEVKPLDIPILFLTAYGQVHPREQLLAAGGDELIVKPVDFVALHTTIARVYLHRLG